MQPHRQAVARLQIRAGIFGAIPTHRGSGLTPFYQPRDRGQANSQKKPVFLNASRSVGSQKSSRRHVHRHKRCLPKGLRSAGESLAQRRGDTEGRDWFKKYPNSPALPLFSPVDPGGIPLRSGISMLRKNLTPLRRGIILTVNLVFSREGFPLGVTNLPRTGQESWGEVFYGLTAFS